MNPEPSETPGRSSVEVRATRPDTATSADTVRPESRPRLSRDQCQNTDTPPEALAARCRASIRDCERVLREHLGLSRAEAKRLAAGGWAAMAKADGNGALDMDSIRAALADITCAIARLEKTE